MSLLVGLLFALMAAAQPGKDRVEERRMELRFYIRGTGDFEGLLVRAQGRTRRDVALRLSPGRRSAAVDYNGSERFILWREDGRNEKGEMHYRAVGAVDLPMTERCLVFVIANPMFPADPAVPEFRLFAMDDTHSATPADHLVFFNLTGAELEGVVGDEVLRVRRGLSRPVALSAYLGKADTLLSLTVDHEGRRHVVLKNRLRFSRGRRTLIVLLPPSRPGSFEVEAFRVEEQVRADIIPQ